MSSLEAHFLVGDLIGIASLFGIGLAFAARVPWQITALNGLFFVLMLVQVVLAHIWVQAISALHVVNGVLIIGVTLYLFRATAKIAMSTRERAGEKEGVPASVALKT